MECRNGDVQPMPKVGDNNFAPPPQVVFAPFLKNIGFGLIDLHQHKGRFQW